MCAPAAVCVIYPKLSVDVILLYILMLSLINCVVLCNRIINENTVKAMCARQNSVLYRATCRVFVGTH